MKSYFKATLQVLIILAIGFGFVWLTSLFNKQKPSEEIAKEVVKEVILKRPSCPNTSESFTQLKDLGQIVVLAKNLNSYGKDGVFVNEKFTVVKSIGSGSQIACGYLYVKAHAGKRPLQEKWEHPYIKSGEFGGHLVIDQAILNKEESGATEFLFNLSNINYKEGATVGQEIRKADWAALLNVSDRTQFEIALNTSDETGVIDEVLIAYQCWNPETGQTTHDCQLTVE